MKDLARARTLESSQHFSGNSNFVIMEYLPWPYIIPFPIFFFPFFFFLHKISICYPNFKIFAAHFTTNLLLNMARQYFTISYMSPVKRICVFEHSVMTNFNCACPAIQLGQGSGFLSEGSSWLTARIGDKYQICLTRSNYKNKIIQENALSEASFSTVVYYIYI